MIRVVLVAAMSAGVMVAVPTGPAAAVSTIVVTTTADTVSPSDGKVSLREAIATAASDGDATVIELASFKTYLLDECASGPDNGTLIGGDDGDLTINGHGSTIEQTCPDSGVISFDGDGVGDTLRLDEVTITGADRANDTSGIGGGIGMLHGGIEIVDSVITGNNNEQVAGGGGLYLYDGPGTIINSVFSNNTVGPGGAAMVLRAPTTITGSSITGNHAVTGAAVFHDPDLLTITNSTIAYNRNDDGSAAALMGFGPLDLVHVTLIADEPAQIGYAHPVSIAGSVFAMTVPGSICGIDPSFVTSLGDNYATDVSCDLDQPTDDQGVLNDPMLRTLFRNGGTALSFYPEAGSPLLDAVAAADPQLPAADQRGVARPQNTLGDIGSIEVAECDALFSDVGELSPFCWEIGWLAGSGVTTGFDDGTYRPDDKVTRQSMAAFMYRLAGSERGPDPTCASAPFPDVSKTHPFCGEIDWLVDEGVTTGFGDGTYRPNEKVTRQSMAAFMYRLAGSPDGDDPTCTSDAFPDVPASHPFCGEIAWLVAEGITTGFDDGTYRPDSSVTRQSMAAFMYRLADGHIAA